MSEAVMPPSSPEFFIEVENRVAELFAKMLSDSAMDKEELKENLLDEFEKTDNYDKNDVRHKFNKINLLHLQKSDQPMALLQMICRATEILERPGGTIAITTTKLDKEFSGEYNLFAEARLKEAATKVETLTKSSRPMLDVSEDLYEVATTSFGDTNLLRALPIVRDLLRPMKDLDQCVVDAQRLAMALMVSQDSIREIAQPSS